jgi:glycosyltransferase involved in cell wall biosynthesis
VVVDIHGNLERWDLPQGCKKVLHATGPHWLFWNHAELSRLIGVRERHGIALRPQRHVKPSNAIEMADEVVVLGNDFTRGTFLFGGKPVTRVPISSAYEFAWPKGRDFEKAKKKFLWVGSYGMVHKGLDLALDAFIGMPDLELTVCGRPEKEADFFRLYERHLKQTPNIKLHGWLDMALPDFLKIARTHAAVIYPSSAEGGAGSVIHCMHAGMLPVCTTEASIDLGDFGVHVESGTVEAVQKACREVAAMSSGEVEMRARGAYEHVRREHTREKFRENYRKFAEKITAEL